MEAAFNKMLMYTQDKERRYRCPVDGCPLTFLKADLAAHMNACDRRKVICTAGCYQEIALSEKHTNCGHFWHSKTIDAQQAVADLRKQKARLVEQVEGMTHLTNKLKEEKRALQKEIADYKHTQRHGGGGVEERKRKRLSIIF